MKMELPQAIRLFGAPPISHFSLTLPPLCYILSIVLCSGHADGEVGKGMSANLPTLSKQYLVAKMPCQPRPRRRRISIQPASLSLGISEDGTRWCIGEMGIYGQDGFISNLVTLFLCRTKDLLM